MMGIDPTMIGPALKILFRGVKDLAAFTSKLVSDFGEFMRPHAKALWNAFTKSAGEVSTEVQKIISGIKEFQSTEKGKPENKVRDVVVKKLRDTKGTDKRITETIDNTSTRFYLLMIRRNSLSCPPITWQGRKVRALDCQRKLYCVRFNN